MKFTLSIVLLLAPAAESFTGLPKLSLPPHRSVAAPFEAKSRLFSTPTTDAPLSESPSSTPTLPTPSLDVIPKATLVDAVEKTLPTEEEASTLPVANQSKRQRLKSVMGLGPKDSIEGEAAEVASGILDEVCEVDVEAPATPVDPDCADPVARASRLKSLTKSIARSLRLIKSEDAIVDQTLGDALEDGWSKRGNSSSLKRNAEIWKFCLTAVFKSLKPRKLKKKGASPEDVLAAQNEAATFIRDGLLKLGPTFVKLGQVVSTRTDVLPDSVIQVLKSLQDDVPPFSSSKAASIIQKELNLTPEAFKKQFRNFSPKPLAAASLGQVHTATLPSGKKVAVKIQRSGLKELFDVDLKNLKKLATLLNNFDPKTDGADRNWVKIYEESERLLYLEIDYLNEAKNSIRFAEDFKNVDYVQVPDVYTDLSTERVLTMEFVESLKLTDLDKIEKLGLDQKELALQTANSFLRQIVETGFFHCDPHPGNLCVSPQGKLVYYDFGMMDELQPNVKSGFRTFCKALFKGGPMIPERDLALNAKLLVDGVEEAGVLASNADRLAVEKLARYFMRQFKDTQLGKKGSGIKETVGTDLQTLTSNNVFRFPSTFTFIFRAFASVDGIGKGLDPTYDIGKLAQPFIEAFTESETGYKSEFDKNVAIFSKATGLNPTDLDTAVTSPKRIKYVEETLRSMEEGNLKIRVRSLENEKALERMALTQMNMQGLLLASLAVNVATAVANPIVRVAIGAVAVKFGLGAYIGSAKVKKFDKTQEKFAGNSFKGDE